MINKHFEYEKLVIDKILTLIKDNQLYLTEKENLPQLAKLGYMYDTLWYAGRLCWGSGGRLRGDAKKSMTLEEKEEYGISEDEEANYWDCENNPKYKIEDCEPLNKEIEDLIYDAWGMHCRVSNDKPIYFEDFYKLIKEGRKLSDFDKKMLKPNKTFDEWVDVLTDEHYIYQCEDRKSVASQLLCTLGSEYRLNDEGFVIQTASGADQDLTLYGDWENCIFREDIQKLVDSILEIPEVEETMNENGKYQQIRYYKKIAEEERTDFSTYKHLEVCGLWKKEEGKLRNKELSRRLDLAWEIFDEKLSKIKKGEKEPNEPPMSIKQLFRIKGEDKKKYVPYYTIYDSSTMGAILEGKKVHESYKKEAINVCREILDNAEEENKAKHSSNVDFANKFLLPLLREEKIDNILK